MRKRKQVATQPAQTKVGVERYLIPVDDEWHQIPCGRSTFWHGDLPLSINRVLVEGYWHNRVEVYGVRADPLSDCTTPVKIIRGDKRWHSENNYLGTVVDPQGRALHVIAGGHE